MFIFVIFPVITSTSNYLTQIHFKFHIYFAFIFMFIIILHSYISFHFYISSHFISYFCFYFYLDGPYRYDPSYSAGDPRFEVSSGKILSYIICIHNITTTIYHLWSHFISSRFILFLIFEYFNFSIFNVLIFCISLIFYFRF